MTTHRDGDSPRALAQAESMRPEAVAAMEQRLLAAFAEHHGRTRRSARVTPTRVRWMAAAAALLLSAGAFLAWSVLQVPRPAPGIATALPVRPSAGSTSAVPPVRPSTMATGDPAVRPSQPRAERPRPRPRPAPKVPDIPSVEFVALPGAASLPRFESGSIVRVDLPLSSLAAYGVDISTSGGKGPVKADVLVGQDGEPRAIRLVSRSIPSSFSRSRQ
jgi:hypothetical protein